jgi:hypothetical protein
MSPYLDTIDHRRMNMQHEAPERDTTVLLRQWSAGDDEPSASCYRWSTIA